MCLYYTTRHRARNRSCTERSESGQSVGSDSLPPVALAGAAVTLWAGFFHGFRRPHRAGNLRSRIQAAARQLPALTVFWTTSKLRTFKRVSKHYPQDCKTPLCSRRRRVDLPGLFAECKEERPSTTPSMSQQSPVRGHAQSHSDATFCHTFVRLKGFDSRRTDSGTVPRIGRCHHGGRYRCCHESNRHVGA